MLLSLLAVAGLAGGFIKIAGEVHEGETSAFDNAILYWFRNPQSPTGLIGPDWLVEAARDFTSLGSYALLTTLVVLVLAYLLLDRRWFEATHLSVAVVSGVIVSNLLKVGFNRPRPVFDHAPEVFSAGFPSGHATMSGVVFLTLGAILALHEPRRSLKLLFLGAAVFLTLLVGCTRIYLQVHFPTDVVAGWCLGVGWALSWVLIAQVARKRLTLSLIHI